MTPEIIRRITTAQKSIDQFLNQPFAWGSNDCVRLIDFTLQNAGLKSHLTKVAAYNDYRTARLAMRKAGVSKLETYLDKHFERIAPATALPCDIICYEGHRENPKDKPWKALGLHVGGSRIIGFANGICDSAPDIVAEIAWRVPFETATVEPTAETDNVFKIRPTAIDGGAL